MNLVQRVSVLNDEYKVIVCFGDLKFVKQVLSDYHYPEFNTDMITNQLGTTFCRRGCYPVIAMPEYPRTPYQFSTLAHEAVHAVDDIFSTINDSNRGELFAHCVGAVVRGALSVKKKK